MFYNSHVNKALTLEWIWSKVIMTAYLSQHSVIPGVSQHFIIIMAPWEWGSFWSPQERQWGSWRLKDLPKHLCQTLGSLLFCSLAFSFRTLGKQWQSNRKHTVGNAHVSAMLGLCTVHPSKQRTANQGLQLLSEAKEFLFVFGPFFKIIYCLHLWCVCVLCDVEHIWKLEDNLKEKMYQTNAKY